MNTQEAGITHTPGPWELHADHGTPFVYGPGSEIVQAPQLNGGTLPHRTRLLALVYGAGDAQQAANARLIASAPEMLGMLKSDLQSVESLLGDINAGRPLKPLRIAEGLLLWRHSLRNVIARATDSQ